MGYGHTDLAVLPFVVRPRPAVWSLGPAVLSCGRRGVTVWHDAERRRMGPFPNRFRGGRATRGRIRFTMRYEQMRRMGPKAGTVSRTVPILQGNGPDPSGDTAGMLRRIRRQRHAGMRRTAGFQ